jgi:hypothetical protein
MRAGTPFISSMMAASSGVADAAGELGGLSGINATTLNPFGQLL